jgi:hypothetical protein
LLVSPAHGLRVTMIPLDGAGIPVHITHPDPHQYPLSGCGGARLGKLTRPPALFPRLPTGAGWDPNGGFGRPPEIPSANTVFWSGFAGYGIDKSDEMEKISANNTRNTSPLVITSMGCGGNPDSSGETSVSKITVLLQKILSIQHHWTVNIYRIFSVNILTMNCIKPAKNGEPSKSPLFSHPSVVLFRKLSTYCSFNREASRWLPDRIRFPPPFGHT